MSYKKQKSYSLPLMLAGLAVLAACAQQPSTPSPLPPTAPAPASSTDPAPSAGKATSPASERRPDRCPLGDPAEQVYVDSVEGYCFTYPISFHAGDVISRTVSLLNPASTDTTPVLNVRVADIPPDMTLEQVVAERLIQAAALQPNLIVQRRALRLDGEPAEEIIGLPGRLDARWLFAIKDGRLFTLLFRPMRGASDAVRVQETQLWEHVLETFRFLSGDSAGSRRTGS